MRIQNLNGGNKPPDFNRQKPAASDDFLHVMEKYKSVETDKKTKTTQRTERVDPVRNAVLPGPSLQQITANGLRELVRDSLSVTPIQIKHEIDLICEDDTAEKIDMVQLSELLKLCKDIKG